MGRPKSLGGRTRPRKRGERSATGKDRCNNGGSGGNTGDTNKHPEGLAQVDDVEKPAQEDAQHGQRRDDDAKRAGQRIDDPLQQALDRGEIDALSKRRLCDEQEERERRNKQVRYVLLEFDPSNRATTAMTRATWVWVSR